MRTEKKIYNLALNTKLNNLDATLRHILIPFFPYFQASEDKRSQKEIGDIAGVADVTIRQAYKLMYPFASKLFPDDFKFSTPIEFLPQM